MQLRKLKRITLELRKLLEQSPKNREILRGRSKPSTMV